MQTTISSIARPGPTRVVGSGHSAIATLLDEPIQPIAQTLKQSPCHARKTLVNYGTITTPCA